MLLLIVEEFECVSSTLIVFVGSTAIPNLFFYFSESEYIICIQIDLHSFFVVNLPRIPCYSLQIISTSDVHMSSNPKSSMKGAGK